MSETKTVSPQECYDALLIRIRDGKPFGYDPRKGACVYNPAVNGGCAIGAHMADLYKPEHDLHGGVFGRLAYFPELRRHIPGNTAAYEHVQKIHDTLAMLTTEVPADTDTLPSRMRALARELGQAFKALAGVK